MKKIISLIASLFVLVLWSAGAFAAGDEENIAKLGSFKKTDTKPGIVIPQDTKFSENVKKNLFGRGE